MNWTYAIGSDRRGCASPVMKRVWIYLGLMLFLWSRMWAQEKGETTDPFRLDYKDVYENMHYNQPLRPLYLINPVGSPICPVIGV